MVFSLKNTPQKLNPSDCLFGFRGKGDCLGHCGGFFLAVFLGTFYFPVFSIPRFIVERGFTPAQFQIAPSYAYELHFFFSIFQRLFLQDSNTDWDEMIKNGSISGKKLRIWNFQYGKKTDFSTVLIVFSLTARVRLIEV